MDGVLIRPGLPADHQHLAALRHHLWGESSVAEHSTELAAILSGRPPGLLPLTVFVAEQAGRLIGFAEVGLRSSADGCDRANPVGYLEGWFVEHTHRGQGVGARLVQAAEDWARQQGCREMASDTWFDNEPSQRAHRALGYQVVDRCVNFRKSL